MSNEQIRYLGDLQRLDLKPGDKLVLTLSSRVSRETLDRISLELQAFAGQDVKVLVLDEGMKLGAIGQEKESGE